MDAVTIPEYPAAIDWSYDDEADGLYLSMASRGQRWESISVMVSSRGSMSGNGSWSA